MITRRRHSTHCPHPTLHMEHKPFPLWYILVVSLLWLTYLVLVTRGNVNEKKKNPFFIPGSERKILALPLPPHTIWFFTECALDPFPTACPAHSPLSHYGDLPTLSCLKTSVSLLWSPSHICSLIYSYGRGYSILASITFTANIC